MPYSIPPEHLPAHTAVELTGNPLHLATRLQQITLYGGVMGINYDRPTPIRGEPLSNRQGISLGLGAIGLAIRAESEALPKNSYNTVMQRRNAVLYKLDRANEGGEGGVARRIERAVANAFDARILTIEEPAQFGEDFSDESLAALYRTWTDLRKYRQPLKTTAEAANRARRKYGLLNRAHLFTLCYLSGIFPLSEEILRRVTPIPPPATQDTVIQ